MISINCVNLAIFAVTILTVTILTVIAVIEEPLPLKDVKSTNVCHGKKTCGECTSMAAECHWCNFTVKSFTADRCDNRENLMRKGCPHTSIVATTSSVHYIKNESPRDLDTERNLSVIQLSPQHIKLNLRPHVPASFQVTFRVAENYPVDLYFLLDTSHTMDTYLKTLANISATMASSIQNITKDFRLGFGSFVDKTTLPYTDLTYKRDEYASKYHGFKNRLSLTNDVAAFRQLTNAAPLSSNLDQPEGGFDAIMQVLSCQNAIGWRANSRKMLLFFADEEFHYAGVGKLAGLMVPNDGQCHLNSDGIYTETANQDYPSISQLINKIAETKVNVVFAVTKNAQELYSQLSGYISGSAVGLLREQTTAGDTPDVLKIVQDNYKKIRTGIELKADADEHISVSYLTNCDNQPTSAIPQCSDINIGTSVIFNVTVEARSCTDVGKVKRQTFHISPVGITEKLSIDVEYVCECDCQKPAHLIPRSSECNGAGTLTCGACVCDKGYLGEQCQCDAGNMDAITYENLCRKPRSLDTCEGRGKCECGKCTNCSTIPELEPHMRYTGKYCECNDYDCETYEQKLCGGPTRGVCQCSTCKCEDGYTGKDCGCPTHTNQCEDSKGVICSGRGECVCGVCVCNMNIYQGPKCEFCPSCDEMCDERKVCVQCHLKSEDDPCHTIVNCSHYHMQSVDNVDGKENGWTSCRFRDDTDFCDIDFIFTMESNSVKVQRTKTCNLSLDKRWIIVIVVIAVIVIGLLGIIIWKIIITVHDRKEYARFESEHAIIIKQFDVDNNSEDFSKIYVTPITKFQNPAYRSSKI